jgi:hypothetical protein
MKIMVQINLLRQLKILKFKVNKLSMQFILVMTLDLMGKVHLILHLVNNRKELIIWQEKEAHLILVRVLK